MLPCAERSSSSIVWRLTTFRLLLEASGRKGARVQCGMTGPGLDVIGDVHGMIATYRSLLGALGYRKDRGKWRHPAGRRAIQLGDVLDRGPDPLGALELTRELVESDAGDF